MQRDRHDYVEYELGAEDQIEGTPAQSEKKIKSKNAQDQSSTAGRQGRGGLIFRQDIGGPFSIKIDAQLTPEVAFQNGDFRYNLKEEKVPIKSDAKRTPEVALQKGDFRYNLRDDKQKKRITGGSHGNRRHDNCTSPEDICNDDVWTDTSADDDDHVRQNRR